MAELEPTAEARHRLEQFQQKRESALRPELRESKEMERFRDSEKSGNDLEVYVDGCFEPVSGTGGWAFVVFRDGVEIASGCGHVAPSSNNAMEIVAVLEAARWVDANAPGESATLWSDSVYAVEGCNRWRPIWKSRNWRKRGPDPKARSRPIPDRALWVAIDALLSQNRNLCIAWCKGHSGIVGNERSDELAELGRRMIGLKRAG